MLKTLLMRVPPPMIITKPSSAMVPKVWRSVALSFHTRPRTAAIAVIGRNTRPTSRPMHNQQEDRTGGRHNQEQRNPSPLLALNGIDERHRKAGTPRKTPIMVRAGVMR